VHAKKLDSFFIRHVQPASLPTIVIFLALLAGMILYKRQQGEIAPSPKRHPIAAIQETKKMGIQGPVFNAYPFGGYLIFSGIPVFIDGRADMYGDAFMKEYLGVYRRPHTGDLVRLLDKYKVNWTLLETKAPAVAVLDQLPGWRRLHSDDTAVVHVRNALTSSKP
jgi:hypothetical protein